MKKVFSGLMALAMSAAMVAALAACTPEGKDDAGDDLVYTVYAPDGAPALALANAIDKTEETFAQYVVISALAYCERKHGQGLA